MAEVARDMDVRRADGWLAGLWPAGLATAGRMFWAWIAVGLVATGGYLLLPAGGFAANLVYDGIGVVSAVVMVEAARRRRPPRRHLWYWMAAGQSCSVAGDLVYTLYQNVLHRPPFPSFADVFYMAAYPLIMTGLVVLVRGRRGCGEVGGLLMSAIVATGLGLLSWTFLIRPVLADGSSPLATRLVSVAYPVADIMLLTVIGWLLNTSGVRTVSYRLLAAASVLLLVSDVVFSVLTAVSEYNGGIGDTGWLLSYVLWAAAALHPSVHRLAHPEPRPATFSWVRIVVLAATGLVAPGVLLVQGMLHVPVDWLGAGLGEICLAALAAARFAQLLRASTRLAFRDDLTGVGNRRELERQLIALPESQGYLAVVDLADFQQINDRLGRGVGDALLVAVARLLATALRPGDELTRIGGDKFAVLLPDTSCEAADAVLHLLDRLLRQPVLAGEHQLLVQAHLGMAETGGGIGPAELVRRAEVAVHAAKHAGNGRPMSWHTALDDEVIERARLGAELRTALDSGQFVMHYQPIVTLPDGRLAGVEALVRWRHPSEGLIGPTQFIPVAEANGLIIELGRWILREACHQLLAWDADLGPQAPARISVNVSARQLLDPGLVDTIAALLADAGLTPRRLTVEVTETAAFGGRQALATLHAIHELGIAVALDDFGTGHSSLHLLQECPVDVLKVDKSFVDEINRSGRHRVIAASLVAICAGMQLTAVAEGVETAVQADHLHQLGYRYAQGYYFGRPVPADQLTASITTTGMTAAA